MLALSIGGIFNLVKLLVLKAYVYQSMAIVVPTMLSVVKVVKLVHAAVAVVIHHLHQVEMIAQEMEHTSIVSIAFYRWDLSTFFFFIP